MFGVPSMGQTVSKYGSLGPVVKPGGYLPQRSRTSMTSLNLCPVSAGPNRTWVRHDTLAL